MDGIFRQIDRGGFGGAFRVLTSATALFLCAGIASGQLVTDVSAIPNTGKPPVVLIYGYQGDCGTASFKATFGIMADVLQADGRASVFFDNCKFPNHPPIEQLGNELGNFLGTLKYQNGNAVSQVDMVAHSMGG